MVKITCFSSRGQDFGPQHLRLAARTCVLQDEIIKKSEGHGMVGPRRDSALFAEWRRICWVVDEMRAEDVGVFLQRRGRRPRQRTVLQLTGDRPYECGTCICCGKALHRRKTDFLSFGLTQEQFTYTACFLLAPVLFCFVLFYFSKCPSALRSGRKKTSRRARTRGGDPLLTCLSSSFFCKNFFL